MITLLEVEAEPIQPFPIIQQELHERLGEPHENTDEVEKWRYDLDVPESYAIEIIFNTDQSKIIQRIEAPDLYQYLFWLLVGIFPIILLSIIAGFIEISLIITVIAYLSPLFGFVAFSVLKDFWRDKLETECGRSIRTWKGNYCKITNTSISYHSMTLVLCITLLMWAMILRLSTSPNIKIFMSIFVVITIGGVLTLVYYEVGTNRPKARDSPYHLLIPASGVTIFTLLPLGEFHVMFYIFNSLPGSSEVQTVSKAVAVSKLAGYLLFTLMYLALLDFTISYLELFEVQKDVVSQTTVNFLSQAERYGQLAAYLIMNLTILFATVQVVTYLLYGITQTYILPTEVLLFSSETVHTAYINTDLLFKELPLLPSRVYTIAYYILNLLPLLLLSGFWAHYLITSFYERIMIFKAGTIHEIEIAEETLPNDVSLIIKNTDTNNSIPVIRSISLLLGWKKAVVLNDAALEEFSDTELKAILAHEAYHFKNRDWMANTIASILSLGLGGRNSALVFYGYPQVELNADRYAVKQVGKEAVMNVLRTQDLVFKRSLAVGTQTLDDTVTDRSIIKKRIRYWIVLPYHLLFGGALMNSVHLSVDERIKRIQNM